MVLWTGFCSSNVVPLLGFAALQRLQKAVITARMNVVCVQLNCAFMWQLIEWRPFTRARKAPKYSVQWHQIPHTITVQGNPMRFVPWGTMGSWPRRLSYGSQSGGSHVRIEINWTNIMYFLSIHSYCPWHYKI